MKKLLSLLLFAIIFISCETTQEPKKELEFQLIGSVNINLKRMSETGQNFGAFHCGYYLSDTKIELLSNGEVIETTYPVADTVCDAVYLLKKVEFNKPYTIRMTLNNDMVDSTDEFTITNNDVKDFPYDSLTESFTKQLSWFVEGKYYSDLLYNPEKNINFDLYTNDSILNVYPNPITSSGTLNFVITNEGIVEISVIGIDKSYFNIIYSNLVTPGEYSQQFGDNLNDGLYFVRMIHGGQCYYCPFLKGKKGSPAIP